MASWQLRRRSGDADTISVADDGGGLKNWPQIDLYNALNRRVLENTNKSECLQQPKNQKNDHHPVEDAFDRRLHRNVGVHQPEQNANDDNDK